MLCFCWMSLHFCAAILQQESLQCLTAIQRGLKASGGDTTAPCTSKYYISLTPVGNISQSSLAVLFVSLSLMWLAYSFFHFCMISLPSLSLMLPLLQQSQSGDFSTTERAPINLYVHLAQSV